MRGRHDSLDVSDIEGASSKKPFERRRTLHPFNLTADIECSSPTRRGLRTMRETDPLNPSYKLPSYVAAPMEEPKTPARDIFYTIPISKHVSATRDHMDWSDIEAKSREMLLRRSLKDRDIMAVKDISGPIFRSERRSERVTNPLQPEYIFDGGPLDQVATRMPKHGQMFPRAPHEDFALSTADINKGGRRAHSGYPLELIKTREVNKTDDIWGAQAGTMPTRGPRYWTDKRKDPSNIPEKQTNRVVDIDGTATGTGGQREMAMAPMYRRERQEIARANAPLAQRAIRVARQTYQSAKDRAADVAAVAALQ